MEIQVKLTNRIKVNGTEIEFLSCDFDRLTTQDFVAASAKASAAAAAASGVATEMDAGFQFQLAIRAIARTMTGVDVMDLERITGSDILKVARLGRDFICGVSAD